MLGFDGQRGLGGGGGPKKIRVVPSTSLCVSLSPKAERKSSVDDCRDGRRERERERGMRVPNVEDKLAFIKDLLGDSPLP